MGLPIIWLRTNSSLFYTPPGGAVTGETWLDCGGEEILWSEETVLMTLRSTSHAEATQRAYRNCRKPKDKLSKSVNMRAMNMLGKAEEQVQHSLLHKLTNAKYNSCVWLARWQPCHLDLRTALIGRRNSCLTVLNAGTIFWFQYNELMKKRKIVFEWQDQDSLCHSWAGWEEEGGHQEGLHSSYKGGIAHTEWTAGSKPKQHQ